MALASNLASRLDPLVDQDKTWYWGLDNKLRRLLPAGINHQSFWIFNHHTFVCQKWHRIFFELLTQKTMVHSHCQDCWKVCIYPRDFSDVIRIEEFQESAGFKSKVGMDVRECTTHIWSGYWYCRSMNEGWERFQFVQEWVDEHLPPRVNGDKVEVVEVILKRGCTEFEMAIPDSATWRVTEEQEEYEEWLDEILDFNPFYKNFQASYIKEKIRWKWMRWAHAHGDLTYTALTGGLPLFPPYRVYHHDEEMRGVFLDREQALQSDNSSES